MTAIVLACLLFVAWVRRQARAGSLYSIGADSSIGVNIDDEGITLWNLGTVPMSQIELDETGYVGANYARLEQRILNPRRIFGCTLSQVDTAFFQGLGLKFVTPDTRIGWTLVIPRGLAFTALCAVFVSSVIGLSPLRRLRRRRFGEFCSECGYDLRGSTDRCPECGTLRSGKAGGAGGRKRARKAVTAGGRKTGPTE
jgi:hypothetical protein